jgi:hypothetical protein
MNTWQCDEAPRVLRTIELVVEEVKETIEDVKAIWKRIKRVLDLALMPPGGSGGGAAGFGGGVCGGEDLVSKF